MNVLKQKQLSDWHSIEYGVATWDDGSGRKKSIRNRYKLENGKFDRHSSSEIPIEDLEVIVFWAIEKIWNYNTIGRVLQKIGKELSRFEK